MNKKYWLTIVISIVIAIISFALFLSYRVNKTSFSKEFVPKEGHISIPLEKPPFLK